MVENRELSVLNYPDPQGEFTIAVLEKMPEAEDVAALGASLSRDPASLESRASGITPEMSKRLVSRYFRSYGHSSIGEMGNLFLSIEGISGVVAQIAIDFSRFQGQEASTRYIDLAEGGYLLPPHLREDDEANLVVQIQMSTYRDVLDACLNKFADEGMKEKEALPRALDIAGAFLPGAYRTSVCMSVDIRTVVEHVWRLQSYVDVPAVREVGDHLYTVIDTVCPNSIKEQPRKNLVDLCFARNEVRAEEYFQVKSMRRKNIFIDTENFNRESFKKSANVLLLNSRLLPDTELKFFGTIRASFLVSFRTYREIARHRLFAKSFIIHSEDVDGRLVSPSIAPWYLEGTNEFLQAISQFQNRSIERACAVGKNMTDQLHLLPMGTQVWVSLVGDVGIWLYFLQLRSRVNVHPELRLLVQELAPLFARVLGSMPERLADMEKPSPKDYLRRSKDA